MFEIDSKQKEIVLFSGGRDSTLTASLLMMKNIPLILFGGNSGSSVKSHFTYIRVKELRKKFGNLVTDYYVEDISGSFRKIALENIESDILKYKKNLVVLGEKIALHTHVVNFCIRHGIKKISDGLTFYQKDLPDQREVTIRLLKKFMKKYGIEYESPIYSSSKTVEDVKYKLMQLGLSTKPIEGSTIFGDTFTYASDEIVEEYMLSKETLAHEIVEFLTQKKFD